MGELPSGVMKVKATHLLGMVEAFKVILSLQCALGWHVRLRIALHQS